MAVAIRDAGVDDLAAMVALMVQDAARRQNTDPDLWKVDGLPSVDITATVKSAMENSTPPFRQKWLLAQVGGKVVGVAHSILLPVPPIYAGDFGPPGLIMEDCAVAQDAPEGTQAALLAAAEGDLARAGAEVILASSVAGGDWEAQFAVSGYAPLTDYFAKTALSRNASHASVRRAHSDDVTGIVTASAENRRILRDLDHRFWKPHPEADVRFAAWMNRSLTLTDRDMFVSDVQGQVQGYVISQPATALHIPAGHDISRIGFVDDFYHADFDVPDHLQKDGKGAGALLAMAEGALHARGNDAVLLVCPSAWASKISLLEAAGYRRAITWYIRA